MVQEGIFKVHLGPTEWLSNPVIVCKDDNSIRITIDYRNLNKSLLTTHCPIPRIDDLKASMNGCRYFSKLDLNQAFFQLEISEDSKRLTTFYANGKLMRLNRLPQGVLPASSKLNQALQQTLAHIAEVRVLYDDILIATETREQQYEAIEKVFHTIAENGLTLKKSKCIFVVQDIPFWGMRITRDGVKPCPKKCLVRLIPKSCRQC